MNPLFELSGIQLDQAFEACKRLYPEHAAFYYRRRYSDSSGRFHSTLRLALSAVSASVLFRNGARSDIVLTRHYLSCVTWGNSGCPILFPEKSLLDALLLSDVPDMLVPSSLHMPHPGVAFTLPRGAIPAEKGDLTHILIAQTERDFRDPVTHESYTGPGHLHFDGISEDGLVYSLGIDPTQPLAQVYQEDFREHAYLYNPSLGTLKFVDATEGFNASCNHRILRLGILLLLYLNTPHGAESAARPDVLIRPASTHKGKTKDALWAPNVLKLSEDSKFTIPKDEFSHGQAKTPIPGRTLRKHIRRGHFRVYRDERFTRVKGNWQWIAPTWVGKGKKS
jgi:hypothetical protein